MTKADDYKMAYQEGKHAGRTGEGTNPYPYGTVEGNAWEAGYMATTKEKFVTF